MEHRAQNGPAQTPERPTQLNVTSNPFSPGGPESPSSNPGETEYEVSL